MATQNINIGVNVSDNGTAKKTVKNFQEIEAAATKAQKAAAGISAPPVKSTLAPGGTSGSRRASEPSGVQGMLSGQEYGRGRGSMGATGASARDFANQAQGLGGFVRLYATLAANAFAAEAAFRALSTAMDTTNMIKGLDQLGAASGTALGSLSKQLVNTTGGAISLREAMEATAKASSSGMSSENILRMGKAAKQASQALGVDMSDAVSRISRGITKLEPELLDELGIFVRVDDVVKKYAESTGKAASAVTDFEKRQAFANAVLDQAEKKFGAIDLDTNPYTKLAATIADLTQSTLEFVNMGLTPLVSLLSNSPTALAVVLGGIAATLVKQAIPAISDFRAGLASAAEQSKAVSQKKLQDVKSSLGAEMALRLQGLDDIAEQEFAKFESSSKKLLDLRETNAKKLKKYDQEALRISQLDPVDITPENITYLENLASKQTKISQVYKQIAMDITAYKEVEKEYNKAQQDRNVILTQQHPLWTTIGQNEKVYHDEVNSARQRSASSQIAYTASTRGFMAGMREAVKEFSESKQGIVTTMDLLDESGKRTGTTLTTTTNGLGLFSRSLNFAKNAAVGMTAALGTAISAFAPWLEVIALVVAAGGALISWMSKTQEESAATSTALTGIKDATKNLSDTLDAINKKPLLQQFDPKSVAATAAAISGLTDQIRNGFDSAYKELDKMGASDQFVNWVTKLWNGDVESELSDRVSKGLANVFKNIDRASAVSKAAEKTIQDLLKIDDLSSADAIGKALDSMSSAERRRALDQISTSVKSLGMAMQVSAARGVELQASFGKVGEALTKFRTGFAQKDPVTEYGQALVDTYFKLSAALDDPQQKLQAIKTLAEGIKNIDAPVEIVLGLQTLSKEIDNLNQVSKSIAGIDAEISKLQSTTRSQIELTRLGNETNISAGEALENINAQIAGLKSAREIKVGIQLNMRAQVEGASKLIGDAQLAVFKNGADLVANKLSTEWTKAGVTVTNAVATVLSGTQTGIKMRAEAEKAMLSAQVQQIKVQQQQILATESNTIALEQANLNRDKENADKKDVQAGGISKIEKRQADLDARSALVKQAQSGKMPARGMYSNMLSKVGTEAGANITSESLGLVQSLEGSMAQIANITAQIKAVNISSADQEIQLKYKREAESLKRTSDILKVEQDRLAVSKEINSETNTAAILEKQALNTRIADINYQTASLATQVEIARLQKVQTEYKPNTDRFRDIESEITRVKDVQKANEQAYAGTKITQGLKDRIEIINSTSKASIKAANDQFVLDTRTLDSKVQQLDTSEKLFDAQAATGLLSSEYILLEKSTLAEKKAQLDFAKESLAAQNLQKTALEEIKRKEDELNATRDARIAQFDRDAQGAENVVQYTDAELAAQKEIAAERTKINSTYDNTAAKAKGTLDVLLQVLGITRETNLEQERYNQLVSAASDFSNTLKMGFEGAAESSQKIAIALGDVATTMAEVALNADKRAKAEKLAQENVDKAWESMDYAALSKAEKEQADLKKKNAKQELADDIKTVNSAKKLFKEKTAAYKILNGIEKVMHITKLAMDAKELAVKLGSLATGTAAKEGAEAADTSSTIAGTIGRLPAYAAEIYGKTIGQLGPIAGPAVATALVAAMFAMFGKGGGGGGGFVPTAAQRQETQGTAMGYDSQGNKVQVRQGVLGDTSAKSTAIANSLERLQENSVVGLSYDNKMLAALKRIANGIEGAAKGLYRIPGLVSGSISGTMEGSSSGGNWLTGKRSTSTQITDSGVQILGNMYELFRSGKARINLFETVSTTSSSKGFLGFGGGSSTSVNTLFKNLELENERAYDQLLKALGAAGDMVYAMAEYAGVAEDVVSTALQSLSVDELVSLRGLKGEEFINELQSLVGALVSDSAYAIMGEYEQFANFGEDLFETIVRVQNSNNTVRQQLKNMMMQDIEATLGIKGVVPEYRANVSRMASSITWASGDQGHQDWSTLANMGGQIAAGLQDAYNKTLGGTGFTDLLVENFSKLSDADVQSLRDAGFAWAKQVTTVIEDGITRSLDRADIQLESARITEDLIKRAGGEEQFFEQSMFFMENFLTEAERLAPRQAAATAELARLAGMGYTSADGLVDTREEFKLLVQSLDLTNPAIRAVYQSLMLVQDDFIAMTPELKAVGLSAKDFAEKLKSMRMSILELTGTPQQVLAAQRAEILSETDQRLKSTQQYIFALEDVKTAEADLTKARENEVNSLKQQKSTTDSTINSLKNYINSLKKFKDSLLLGSASPLTPAQRYAESKSQFDAILATAMGTAATPEEQRTKDAALSQLESSASAFLDASRIYNASSAQYTEDFGLVQSALSNTETALTSQLTTEEKSLLALESQISAIEAQLSVSKSILTVLEATQALTRAQAVAAELKSVDLRQTAMSTKRAVIDNGTIFGAQGETSTQNVLGQNLNAWMSNAKADGSWASVNHFYDNLVNKWGFNSTEAEWLLGVPKSELLDFFGSYNLPAFAMGTNFVPEDMVAQIHQGERIVPAADNAELMASVGNRNRTNEVLVAEIRKLNQKIDSLEKTVANGSIINAEATNRNTVEITNSVKDTKTTASYSEALRRRTQVV